MRRLKRLGIFTLLVLLVLASLYFGVQAVFEHELARVTAQREIVDRERAEIAINLFYSRYHAWPSAPGPIGADAAAELGGFETAQINTDHINFFKKADSDMYLLDRNGREFFFKPDDAKGTCTVYSESETSKP